MVVVTRVSPVVSRIEVLLTRPVNYLLPQLRLLKLSTSLPSFVRSAVSGSGTELDTDFGDEEHERINVLVFIFIR